MQDENVIEVLNDQLPKYFRPVVEIQEILKAHGYILQQIETEMTRMRDNLYISTCDWQTVFYYENLLGINRAKGVSLEERRSLILMRYSMRPLYTLPMLKEMLEGIVGENNYLVKCQSEKCQLTVILIGQDIEKVREIYDTVALINPAHIELFFNAEYVEKCELSVRYAESIRFRTGFYPRFNLPQLKLDGRWKLDGKKKLGGYDSGETVDLYPVALRFRTDAEETVEAASRIHLLARARIPEDIHSRMGLRMRSAVECQVDTSQKIGIRTGAEEAAEAKSRLHVRTNAQEEVRSHTGMTIRTAAEHEAESKEQLHVQTTAACTAGVGEIRIYNKNQLSSGWKLNGSRKLNGGTEIR